MMPEILSSWQTAQHREWAHPRYRGGAKDALPPTASVGGHGKDHPESGLHDRDAAERRPRVCDCFVKPSNTADGTRESDMKGILLVEDKDEP
jgi:hypothetical protein